MFSALQNVVPSHLADPDLFDFKSLTKGQTLKHGGDLAFDRESMPQPFTSASDGLDHMAKSIKIEPAPPQKVINILASKPKE